MKEIYFGNWLKVIDTYELDKVMRTLENLYLKTLITPSMNNVFKVFNICPYNDLKVIMIGQDPYPQKDAATGIAFGNFPNIPEDNLSISLKVIREAFRNSKFPDTPFIFDTTMQQWSNQGILMLNSALTVEVNKIGSHTMLWRSFISKLLQNLSNYSPGLIYVLYGNQAKTFKPYINKNNVVFEVNHPAYYARTNQIWDTTIFDQINTILKQKNNTQIEWYEKILYT